MTAFLVYGCPECGKETESPMPFLMKCIECRVPMRLLSAYQPEEPVEPVLFGEGE